MCFLKRDVLIYQLWRFLLTPLLWITIVGIASYLVRPPQWTDSQTATAAGGATAVIALYVIFLLDGREKRRVLGYWRKHVENMGDFPTAGKDIRIAQDILRKLLLQTAGDLIEADFRKNAAYQMLLTMSRLGHAPETIEYRGADDRYRRAKDIHRCIERSLAGLLRFAAGTDIGPGNIPVLGILTDWAGGFSNPYQLCEFVRRLDESGATAKAAAAGADGFSQ